MQMENKKRMPQQAPQAKADKAPAEQDTALVWGKNPVTELLKSEAGVDTLLLADSMEPRMAGYYTALGKAAGAVIKRVPAGKLQKLCGTQDHQGVAAWAARIQYVGVEELLQIAKDRGEPPFLVLCDGIEDPHNLGAILRSALLCGAHGVIIPRRGGVGVTGTVIHNSYHENLINYMAPLDIPVEDLEQDFNGVSAHVIDGKVYYIDYGMMTGSVYYNKDMWKEAGLTEDDIPKTWDEMIEVAKKLTIKDGDKIVQAGLNFNNDFHQNYLLGLNYQLGENLFQEDGKTPNVNSDAMKKVMQMLVDMYDKDQIGSKDFGENCADSFGQGQSAMVIQWGHYYNTLKTTWSDIDFGVFEIPTFDGNPYAYNRYNGESTFGVNKNAPKDQQAVAQDFVKFFLCDDESQVAFNLAMSTFPAKKSLADNEKILENPSLKVLAEHIDHYIWPGPMPSCVEDNMKKAGEDIFYNGVDIDTALDKAQADIIKDMKSSSFQSVENLYEFAK